jgi:AsmA protein
MHSTNTHSGAETELNPGSSHRLRRRLALILTLVLVLLLLAFIPPLINVNRFQRRVDRNISTAIGRPVHFDKLTLNLLPMPGFTLDNFVVDEDPEFGSEPILRANEVQVTLRISSLWSRHVEFSKISLTEPSVNLVHLPDGRWNIESLLFQASHIEAAPTAQRFAGPAPRFPYIEATGARLNLKLDQEKLPFSFTEADFALWLPVPHQWHLRLEARPIRTDTAPGETGTLRTEGVLGGDGTSAGTSLAQIPIDLQGRWQDAQLGGLSLLVLGHDAGLRGDASLTFSILGTVEHSAITTDITVANARRADFVPSHSLSFEAGCKADAQNTFRAYPTIECHWPPADSSGPSTLILTGSLPDVRNPDSGSAHLTIPGLPVATLLDWLQVATPHPPIGLQPAGILTANLNWGSATTPAAGTHPTWTGELELANGAVQIAPGDRTSIPLNDLILRSTPATAPPTRSRHHTPAASAAIAPDSFDLLPIPLPLGGKDPATLECHLDDTGYSLHLSGSALSARVLDLGHTIPQLGDGLKDFLQKSGLLPPAPAEPASAPRGGTRGSVPDAPAPNAPAPESQPVPINLTATRTWGSGQVWRQNATPAPRPRPHR